MYEIIIGRNEADKKKYGTKGTILLGKHYVKMGQMTSLSNPIYMDVTRAHVVFVCGKRGGGKCLTGDTLITLNDGSRVPIREIYETYSKKGKKTEKEEDYYELKDELYVKSFDIKNESIIDKKVTHVFRRKVNEEIAELVFSISSNKKILLKTTKDHKILTKQEGIYGWVTPKDTNISEVSCFKAPNEIGHVKVSKIRLTNFEGFVYDLTIKDSHNFIANDIIVHNSYSMGVMAEGMSSLPEDISKNLSIVILDTMGIYWTMKYANQKDEELLKEWGLKGKGLDVKIYTPAGFYDEFKDKGIPTDHPFALKPSELSPEDWCLTFEVSQNDPLGVAIEWIILELKKKKKDFSMDDIIEAIKEDKNIDNDTKNAIENRFIAAKNWGVFSEEGTPLKDIVNGGQVTVLDVSCYATMPGGWKIKALVIGIVAQKLFLERMVARRDEEFRAIHKSIHYFGDEEEEAIDTKDPLVWLIIDEAHEFMPNDGKTAATDALVTILREGRQPGISLILATQQPGKIHTDVMTQSDILLSHRITAKVDTDALGKLMQSYMREGLDKFLNELPRVKGSAIILDDANERIYPMRIRPRITWHGGEDPNAMPKVKKEESYDDMLKMDEDDEKEK